MELSIKLYDEEDTKKLAKIIANKIGNNIVICLIGELGAGKTFFVKSLAKELGFKDSITSPTFTYVKQYENDGLQLTHIDLYRLTSAHNNEDIIENFYNDGIVAIEWPQLLSDHMPSDSVYIKFSIDENNVRTVLFEGTKENESLITEVINEFNN